MKHVKLATLISIPIATLATIAGITYFSPEPEETTMPTPQPVTQNRNDEQQHSTLVLEARTGDAPSVTDGIPHIQLDQASEDAIYDKLTSQTYAIEGITGGASQSSLPGALTISLDPELAINQNAIINGREFAHIHADPGRGSLHLILSIGDAAAVVESGWGVYHPFHESGSKPGMVMVFAPRDDNDLETITSIITASLEFAKL